MTDTVKGHASPAASASVIMTSEREGKRDPKWDRWIKLRRDSDFISGQD